MSHQATLARNARTGMVELRRANQQNDYDEDSVESSSDSSIASAKMADDYFATDILVPARQRINEIQVRQHNNDEIEA